jgi:hypothetical protein
VDLAGNGEVFDERCQIGDGQTDIEIMRWLRMAKTALIVSHNAETVAEQISYFVKALDTSASLVHQHDAVIALAVDAIAQEGAVDFSPRHRRGLLEHETRTSRRAIARLVSARRELFAPQ